MDMLHDFETRLDYARPYGRLARPALEAAHGLYRTRHRRGPGPALARLALESPAGMFAGLGAERGGPARLAQWARNRKLRRPPRPSAEDGGGTVTPSDPGRDRGDVREAGDARGTACRANAQHAMT